MKTKTCRVLLWILIGLALVCGLGLPRFLLTGLTPLARTAVCAGGQLLAYVAMAAFALAMEPQLTGLTAGHGESTPSP
jgi:hypothetical protein